MTQEHNDFYKKLVKQYTQDLYLKYSDFSGYGLFLKSPAQKGDVVISIPKSLTISNNDLADFADFSKESKLIIRVIYEYCSNSNSIKSLYIKKLPREIANYPFWNKNH